MKEITPRMVASASRCLHFWYLECHGNPDRRTASEPRFAGVESPEEARQRRVVEWLPDLAEPAWNGLDPRAAFAKTLDFMKRGRAWIYKGVLVRKGMWGEPDLLRRVEGRSALGDFSYAPLVVRPRPGPLTRRDLFELRTHALLLEAVQGKRPRRGWAYLGPGDMVEIDLRAPAPEFDMLLLDMERIRKGEFVTEGSRLSDCETCVWRDHCKSLWADSGHVCLLPGVTTERVAPLRDAGFSTWRRIADVGPGDLVSKAGIPPAQALDIWLHARARRRGAPVIRRRATFVDNRPIHFVDGEFVDDHCVVLGSSRYFQGESRTKQFVARAATDRNEADIWRAFLEHLAPDKEAVIFPWAESDGRRFRSLWERHGGLPELRKTFREPSPSLRQFVRAHFALPVTAYRLEEVAALFPRRRGVPLTTEAVRREAFQTWQETQDRGALQELMDSHREKLRSLQSIYFGLKTAQLTASAA